MNNRRDRSPFNTHADLQRARRAIAYGELSRLSPREPAIMPGHYNARSVCAACERLARLAVIAIAVFVPFFLFYAATR
jgi:hypothetical protein